MIAAILLAAGRGTRIKSTDRNKVTLPFLNKPLIVYGVELMRDIADATIVVVGAYHESVMAALTGYDVLYAHQENQLGTAHAAMAGIEEMKRRSLSPTSVLICYGDHTMFYKKQTVKNLLEIHEKEQADLSFLTTESPEANKLAWGRIIRDSGGHVTAIVEQKDATEEEKNIHEINPGFYLARFDFLEMALPQISPSSVSGEYYITDLIKIAVEKNKKIQAVKVPFTEVGIGVNQMQELDEGQKIYLSRDSGDTF